MEFGLEPQGSVQFAVVRLFVQVAYLSDLPQLNCQAHETRDLDDKIGLIVTHVEQHHQRLEHVEEYAAHRKTFQRLSIVPELDI